MKQNTTLKQRPIATMAALAALLLVSLVSRTDAQIVVDGGFETPHLGTGNYGYNPPGSPWTYIGLAGITDSGSSAWGVPAGCTGDQVAILQQQGAISQVITFPQSSAYYLSWKHAGRSNGGNQHYDVTAL